jgi:hypothetical protein
VCWSNLLQVSLRSKYLNRVVVVSDLSLRMFFAGVVWEKRILHRLMCEAERRVSMVPQGGFAKLYVLSSQD